MHQHGRSAECEFGSLILLVQGPKTLPVGKTIDRFFRRRPAVS
jgi:hypothetical protein